MWVGTYIFYPQHGCKIQDTQSGQADNHQICFAEQVQNLDWRSQLGST